MLNQTVDEWSDADEADMLRIATEHFKRECAEPAPSPKPRAGSVFGFGALSLPAPKPLVGNGPMVFVCCDYSQIEARVLAWLAGQEDILQVFRDGKDVYVHTAQKIGSTNRQLGKVCVLGLGFGMGWRKFVTTAKMMGGLDLAQDFAEGTVRSWRQANPKIVAMWYRLDDAFRDAIVYPVGTRFTVRDTPLIMERGTDAIGIFLPSRKRRLIYRNPRLVPNPESFHETGTDIHYDGIQQMSKKWGAIKTYGGKLAENVTQAVARDVMAAGLLEMDALGLDLRMTVHDEVIAVCDADRADVVLNMMLGVMRAAPPWAAGLPVWAEGWTGARYKK
jgi:DNA polymerase